MMRKGLSKIARRLHLYFTRYFIGALELLPELLSMTLCGYPSSIV
jgi:hypothetical protein